MKLEQQTHSVTAQGMTESAEWGIKATPEALRILMEGLFSNPIAAIIRELCVGNAVDAHMEVGNKEPFRVQLPTYLAPTFKVRDYGPGMSHEFMMGDFTKLFHSTKADSNDMVGAFGHGRTSPWSYTDSWMAISYTDKKRTYSAYMDETTGYTISLLGEEELGDEPQGYEVQVPVKNGDEYRFRSHVEKLLSRLDPQPLVYEGDGLLTLPEFEYVMVGQGWKLRKSDQSSWQSQGVALMGGIAYPINTNDLETELIKVLKAPMDFEFNIGDLEITPSREGLKYTDKTKQALYNKAQEVYDQLEIVLEDELKDCATEWERMVLTNKISKDLFRIAKVGKDGFSSGPDIKQVISNYTATRVQAKWLGNGYIVRPDDECIVVVNDEPSKRTEKLTYYMKTKGLDLSGYRSNVRMFLVEKRKDDDTTGACQTTLDRMGNPPVIYVSDLPRDPDKVPVKGQCSTITRTVTKLKRYNRYGELVNADKYDTSKGGIYINIRDNYPHDSDYNRHDIKKIIQAFNLKVYALPGSVSEKKFIKSGKWCKFDTYVDKLMEGRAKGVDSNVWRQYYLDTKSNLSHENKKIISLVSNNLGTLRLPMKSRVGLLSTTDRKVIDCLIHYSYLEPPTKEVKVYSQDKLVKHWKKKHPILSLYVYTFQEPCHDKVVVDYINQGELK